MALCNIHGSYWTTFLHVHFSHTRCATKTHLELKAQGAKLISPNLISSPEAFAPIIQSHQNDENGICDWWLNLMHKLIQTETQDSLLKGTTNLVQ